jgi:RNA polymerase sigma-70 factor (ECF subfamily)
VEDRPLAENVLIQRAKDGDPTAYEELVRSYQEVAFRTAFLVTRNAADAEDVTQEAFLKAWRALRRFRLGAPFRPWLLRIVTNEALNRRRSVRLRLRLWERARADGREGDAVPSPSTAPEAAAERRKLLQAIDALPESHRIVFAYRHILGLSEAEVAHVLSLPVGTVKSRNARALTTLREELGRV